MCCCGPGSGGATPRSSAPRCPPPLPRSLHMRKLSLLLVTLALSACAVGPDYHRPEVPAPPAFVSAAEPGFVTDDIEPQFWKLFQDAELDRLVTQALAANHDVRIAAANLRRARAARTESRFDLGPTVTAEGGRTEAK